MKIEIIIFGLFCLALGGCGLAGSPTYGTGKTQESLLFETLTSIPLLTSGGEKEGIDYVARPGLVAVPNVAELPLPLVDVVVDESFPVDPETQRAEIIDIIKQAEDSNQPLPENIQAIRSAELERAKQRSRAGVEQQNIIGAGLQTKPRKSFWQRLRESFSDKDDEAGGPIIIDANDPEQVAAIQAPKRTSLAEPPSKYRTPEPTAPIGDVGTPEIDLEKAKAEQAKKDEGSIFDIFKRKKKTTSADEEEESEEETESNEQEASTNTGTEVNGLY